VTDDERPDVAKRPGLLDTSVFIALESGRPHGTVPDTAAISVVTLAELQLGVLMADDPAVRAQRLRTLSAVESTFSALPVTESVARTFAQLAAEARRAGQRPKVMDLWIAATALTNELDLYTQDQGFDTIPRVRVVYV
jgi:predicted nucleic acid-binding protein